MHHLTSHLQTHSLHQPTYYLILFWLFLSFSSPPSSRSLCDCRNPRTYIHPDTCSKPRPADIVIHRSLLSASHSAILLPSEAVHADTFTNLRFTKPNRYLTQPEKRYSTRFCSPHSHLFDPQRLRQSLDLHVSPITLPLVPSTHLLAGLGPDWQTTQDQIFT